MHEDKSFNVFYPTFFKQQGGEGGGHNFLIWAQNQVL